MLQFLYLYSCTELTGAITDINNKKVSTDDQKKNTIIHHCIQTHCTMGKSHRAITVTRHQEDKQSKSNSSLFLMKVIAKLERIQNTTQQNMEQTQNPHNESNNKQGINNNRAAALEQTTASVTGILLVHIFATYSFVVKAQTLFSLIGGFLTIAMYHHRETI